MGFYGNVTNTSGSQFQFDRIYTNRCEMEINAKLDGIYAGRYVLIEYDNDYYPIVYQKNGGIYTSPNCEEEARIKIAEKTTSSTSVVAGTRVRIYTGNAQEIEHDIRADEYNIYKLIGSVGLYAELAELTEQEKKEDPHYYNYNVDREYAASLGEQIGRGWDSTVWQKVYTHGEEKYVMIAELNSVVPTFAVSADAPTMAPITPHFDTSSTNVYYLMHQQPHWGFRIKAANGELKGPVLDENGREVSGRITNYSTDTENKLSDEKTTWTRVEYDKNTGTEKVHYYDGTKWVNEKVKDKVDAAIFYNRAGFDVTTESRVDTPDEISLMPTGQSGHEYNAHKKPGEKEVREDIQELSIMLPSIGNSISEMWNIVYGPGAVTDNKRNMDVEWGSTNGHRMLSPLQGGDGYSYAPEQTKTIAGAINSVHDLMGMIISTDYNPTNGLPDDMGKIYHYNNKFYRKAKTYEYDPAEYEFIKVALTQDTYTPNYYYYKSGSNYEPDLNNSFNSAKEYYVQKLKRTENKPLVTGEELFGYAPNNFYILDGKDYLVSREEAFNKHNTYYRIKNSTEKRFDENYEAGKYYAKTNTSPVRYELLTGSFDGSSSLYSLNIAEVNDGSLPFAAGRYYTSKVTDEGEIFSVALTYDKTLQYYRRTPAPEAQGNEYTIVQLFDLSTGNYYIQNGNVYEQTQNSDLEVYYKVTEKTEYAGDELYIPGSYYYLENGNYKLGIGNTALNNTIYYVINFQKVEYFYEPDKYLFIENNTFIKDLSPAINLSRQYYLPMDYYVMSDSSGFANRYSKWNNKVENVPCTVQLGKRRESFKMVELEGFGRTLNTIHGLILEINHLIETKNYEHRDNETVRGLANQIKDIIFQFGELNPKDVVIVDDYGRMHGAAINGDKWISTIVDSNVSSANIDIKHNTATIQKTTDETYNFNTSGTEFTFGQNEYDEAGHAAKSHNIKVTMPNGIREITVNADSGNFNKEATSPIDSCAFGIKGDNNIISTSFNGSDMTIAHKNDYSTETTISTSTQSLKPEDRVLTDYSVVRDTSGHIIKVTGTTKKLPVYHFNILNSSEVEGTGNVPVISDIQFNDTDKTQMDVSYYNLKPLWDQVEGNTNNISGHTDQIGENTKNLEDLTARMEAAEENILSNGMGINAITLGSNIGESSFDLANTGVNFKHQISLNKTISKSKNAGENFALHKSSSDANLVTLKIKKSGLYEISGSVYLKVPQNSEINELVRPGCYIQKIEYSESEQNYVYTELNSAVLITPTVVANDLVVSTGNKIVYLEAGTQIGLFARMSSYSQTFTTNWVCHNNNTATYLTIRALGEQDALSDLEYDN